MVPASLPFYILSFCGGCYAYDNDWLEELPSARVSSAVMLAVSGLIIGITHVGRASAAAHGARSGGSTVTSAHTSAPALHTLSNCRTVFVCCDTQTAAVTTLAWRR